VCHTTDTVFFFELNDLTTMQLVPSKINGFFDHLGGVAEAKRAGL
jgi:hypothetical protein